jgi:hypothetical protein
LENFFDQLKFDQEMLEENKKKIITYAVFTFTAAVLSVGIYFKYFKKKESKSEKENKPESKEDEKTVKKEEKTNEMEEIAEKKQEFIPVPELKYISHPLPSKEGENKIFFKTFSVSSNPLSIALHELNIQKLTGETTQITLYSVNSNQTVEECIQVIHNHSNKKVSF